MLAGLWIGHAGTYVAATYVVFLLLIAIYVAVRARKLAWTSRQISELSTSPNRAPDAARNAKADQVAR